MENASLYPLSFRAWIMFKVTISTEVFPDEAVLFQVVPNVISANVKQLVRFFKWSKPGQSLVNQTV